MTDDLSFKFHRSLDKEVKAILSDDLIKDLLNQIKSADKIFIVCDKNIKDLYVDKIASALKKQKPVAILVHKPGEANKNLNAVSKMADEFFKAKGSDHSVIVAIGGGITANMAGLLASILYYGVKLIQVPTTLLSQLDGAVDVKHAVNSKFVKNSIGIYRAPDVVIIDPKFLKTLSDRHLNSGLAEAIKHGFAQDLSLVDYILTKDKHDLEALKTITKRTLNLKFEHWRDTTDMWKIVDQKVERLTNLGHTVGKVLEIIDIGYLTHGEAIAHGMVVEANISKALGQLDAKSVAKIHHALKQLGLLYPLNAKYSAQAILERLHYDNNAKPVFAILKKLGNPKTESQTVPIDITKSALTSYLEQA